MVLRSLVLASVVLLLVPQAGQAQEPPPPDAAGEPYDKPIPPNHLVPLVDIVSFEFLLNRFDHRFIDPGITYDVTGASIRRNLKGPWVVDNDPFDINQFMHPYQGAMYHGFARSAGLNYWEATAYTFAGSLLWELAGETTLPSKNDQIASGIGGSFLGEPMFRLAELMLRAKHHRFLRELAALAISPSTGFNRIAYDGLFRGTEPNGDPPVFARVQFGMMGTASVQKSLVQPLTRNEAVADFSVDYGMPGKAGYEYHRPFDYFDLQFTSSTGSRFESIFTRGMLAGRSYGEGTDRSRGIWGLYGTYDYVAPQIFRVSSVALNLGTTLQRKIAESAAIQSTVLAGVGWGAGGGLGGSNETDYHYGVTPQVLGSMRFIPNDRMAFDVTFRDYYVSRYASPTFGAENIARADALISVRLADRHAVSVRYVWSRRATYGSDPILGNIIQSKGSVGLFYTLFGGTHFGAVEF